MFLKIEVVKVKKVKTVNYSEMTNQIIARLNSKTDIVLATSDGRTVSARTIYYFNEGLRIYFLTSKAYRKFKDIKCNSNVALCMENIQIEGVATSLDHPLDDKNIQYREIIERHYGMKQFLKYKNTVLVRVDVMFVEMWDNNHRAFIDVHKQEAYIK